MREQPPANDALNPYRQLQPAQRRISVVDCSSPSAAPPPPATTIVVVEVAHIWGIWRCALIPLSPHCLQPRLSLASRSCARPATGNALAAGLRRPPLKGGAKGFLSPPLAGLGH